MLVGLQQLWERRTAVHNVNCVEREACTGCGACEVVCPVQCIDMIVDREGFLCPTVDETRCVGCSKCLHSCSAYRKPCFKARGRSVLFRSLEGGSEISSSGGAAFAIVMHVIERGGAVVACSFDDRGVAHHREFETIDDLRGMQGSKYVQSDAREGYRLCISMLEDDREVLFVGTPCQVAAVKRLCPDKNGLITCDLICHGVPSPAFWAKDLEFQNSRGFLVPREDVQFRTSDKRSRTNFELCCKGASGKRIPYEKDPYYSLFVKNASLRESCYTCPYAQEERVGDVTIGDCASRDKYPDFHPCESVSTVVANTSAGEAVLKSVLSGEGSDFVDLDFLLEARLNGQLHKPSTRPGLRDFVYIDLNTHDYRSFAGKYCERVTIKWRLKRFVKLLIPVDARVFLKRKARGLSNRG